jgi:hypothetical protein
MADVEAFRIDRLAEVTLGSVVAWDGERGVVWHATPDTLRILPITRGSTSVPLTLANEVAFHLPVSLGGWSIACGQLREWPRALCNLVGELNDRCLLKVLEARRSAMRAPVPANDRLTAALRHAVGR